MGNPDRDSGRRSISHEVREVSNILLLVSPLHPADLDACMDLLTVTEPENENVWSLGITITPNKRVENWEQVVGTAPASFRIVSVGDLPEAKAREAAKAYGYDPEPHFVTIPDGSALTRIGVELMAALDEWDSSPAETVICFHSVSSLLQYASEERVFQFLNTFTAEVEQADASAHYHMDPEVHEDSTVAKVKHLVDAVIESDADDEYRVTVR